MNFKKFFKKALRFSFPTAYICEVKKSYSQKGRCGMKQDIRIKVSKKANADDVVRVKKFTVREKLLSKLLGPKHQVTIIVPGKNVDALSIVEVGEGGGG